MMNLFLNKDGWQREYTATWWMEELKQYSNHRYIDEVISRIEKRQPKDVFEVGISSGFPFAARLLQKGIDVYGCDISLPLLHACNQEYPSIITYHTGYEGVPKLVHQTFDVVYCMRSSWYFPDVYCAIKNMLLITKKSGVVILDVMNNDSPRIQEFLKELRHRWYLTVCKNIVKKVFNTLFQTQYIYANTSTFVPHFPVSYQKIDQFLTEKKLSYERRTFEQVSGESTKFDPKSFRMLYVIET